MKLVFPVFERCNNFLSFKNYNTEHLQLLLNPEWIQNFCFLVDIIQHFNKLNLKLQGKNTALQLLEKSLYLSRN